LSLPFGAGRRMCVGRRLAETSIHVLVNKILSRYKLEWNGEELDGVGIINKPDKPLKFKVYIR
jgi:cytochrome P450